MRTTALHESLGLPKCSLSLLRRCSTNHEWIRGYHRCPADLPILSEVRKVVHRRAKGMTDFSDASQ